MTHLYALLTSCQAAMADGDVLDFQPTAEDAEMFAGEDDEGVRLFPPSMTHVGQFTCRLLTEHFTDVSTVKAAATKRKGRGFGGIVLCKDWVDGVCFTNAAVLFLVGNAFTSLLALDDDGDGDGDAVVVSGRQGGDNSTYESLPMEGTGPGPQRCLFSLCVNSVPHV